MKVAIFIIRVCIMLPIFMWLMYQVFRRVEATELMWFLYWTYIPLAIVSGVVAAAIENDKAQK